MYIFMMNTFLSVQQTFIVIIIISRLYVGKILGCIKQFQFLFNGFFYRHFQFRFYYELPLGDSILQYADYIY